MGMKAALNTYGPLSIGMNANPLQHYKSGIFDASCVGRSDHGVVIVGYGSENGKQYWKVRNSWGASFGENGYFRIAWGKDLCNVADDVTTATGISVDGSPPTSVPCDDKDLDCASLAESFCGTSSTGCLNNGCDPDLYDVQKTGFSGGKCHYHCTCKNKNSTAPIS